MVQYKQHRLNNYIYIFLIVALHISSCAEYSKDVNKKNIDTLEKKASNGSKKYTLEDLIHLAEVTDNIEIESEYQVIDCFNFIKVELCGDNKNLAQNMDSNIVFSVEFKQNNEWTYTFLFVKLESQKYIMKLKNLKFPLDIPEYIFMPNALNSFFYIDGENNKILFFGFGGYNNYRAQNLNVIAELDENLNVLSEFKIKNQKLHSLIINDTLKNYTFIKEYSENIDIPKVTEMKVDSLYYHITKIESYEPINIATFKASQYQKKIPSWLTSNGIR